MTSTFDSLQALGELINEKSEAKIKLRSSGIAFESENWQVAEPFYRIL